MASRHGVFVSDLCAAEPEVLAIQIDISCLARRTCWLLIGWLVVEAANHFGTIGDCAARVFLSTHNDICWRLPFRTKYYVSTARVYIYLRRERKKHRKINASFSEFVDQAWGI